MSILSFVYSYTNSFVFSCTNSFVYLYTNSSINLFMHYFADTLSCDFDQGTFCRWTNSKEDDFDWLIGKSTPTLTTGPSEDHTSRNGELSFTSFK